MKSAEISQAIERLGLYPISDEEASQFEAYLTLLLEWNARLNLTAVREPAEIVRRHFAESIQCSRAVPAEARTLLDYGSGAGLPGIPCAIGLPAVRCTLAESQGRKASFLREVLRKLTLNATVHAGRVQTLPASRTFDVVTLRAVDQMELACADAIGRVSAGGRLLVMATEPLLSRVAQLDGVRWSEPQLLAGSSARLLRVGMRV